MLPVKSFWRYHTETMERDLAPGKLALVEQLVNTVEVADGARDDIATPGGLAAWLGAAGYVAQPSESDVARVLQIREGIRSLLEANMGDPVDADALESLNQALSTTSVRLQVGEDGAPELVAGGGIDTFVADLADAMLAATADGTWARLKVCRDDTCRWAFYDRSKNRSGVWCSMDDCGSKAKMRTYRERKAGSAG
jgi:predicted RNA-binding Zn ribbon-like protein